MLAFLALSGGLAACGGDSGGDPGSTSSGDAPSSEQGGDVQLRVEDPRSASDGVGYRLWKAVRPERLADALVSSFELPRTLTLRAVPGLGGGPYYDPRHHTIVLQYGFAALVFDRVAAANPTWSQRRIGEAVGAVLSFITAHEFGHALIAVFDLPVLGREEDAADSIATQVLLAGPAGNQLALDSALFWADFSTRQSPPQLADYADVHSFDLQRSLTIICHLAGSSEERFNEVARLGALPRSRLAGCPAEYEQSVDSLNQVLEDHLEQPLE